MTHIVLIFYHREVVYMYIYVIYIICTYIYICIICMYMMRIYNRSSVKTQHAHKVSNL